ncbi:MAG: hypothetical protein AB7I50_06065 [Vicinamibacterales bacterium]
MTAHVLYRHDNLVDYAYDVAVPAHARATVLTPAGVPDGGFALSVTVLEGVPIAVERLLYGGDAWTVGTAGVGSIGAGTTWRFAEGITRTPFDTYFHVLNLGFSTTVTFTFVTDGGTTITQGLWVLGGGGRAVLLADSVSGLSTGSFKTTVTSSQPVVVERATYWAAVSGSALIAGGGAGLESVALDDGTAAVAKGGGGGGGSGPQRPWYHDLTKPEAADAISAAREAGGVSPDETARVAGRQAERDTARSGVKAIGGAAGQGGGGAQASSSLPWIGGHLTLGRRP